MVDCPFNVDPILALVKALYKFVFLIYIIASVWNGFLIENYLMQGNWAVTKWFPFFKLSDFEDCKNFIDVCTSQRCLQYVFLKDQYEVYSLALKLGKFSKTHYLLMAFIAHSLAPIIHQIIILGLPILGLVLSVIYLVKLTQKLEGDAMRCPAKQTATQSSVFQELVNYCPSVNKNKIITILGICSGMLATSIIISPIFVKSYEDIKTSCETPLCLYCYPKLLHTIFKEVDEGYNYNMFWMPTRLLVSGSKLVTVAILICVLYATTILTVALTLWTFVEALWNVKRSFDVIHDYLSRDSPEISSYYSPQRTRGDFETSELQ